MSLYYDNISMPQQGTNASVRGFSGETPPSFRRMNEITSVLGKRKYESTPEEGTNASVRGLSGEINAICYENEDPEIQQENLDIKYETIPKFPKHLFETSDGLQQILDWFNGYNTYLQSKYMRTLETS